MGVGVELWETGEGVFRGGYDDNEEELRLFTSVEVHWWFMGGKGEGGLEVKSFIGFNATCGFGER